LIHNFHNSNHADIYNPASYVYGHPRFQERCHPSRQYTRGLEDMTNASLQRGRQG
jgi:hypothetical protein